ncbi:MAG: hypothetical protein QCI00_05565, partial [Candidatus Thermoplasmatota archaeon]|nr:hypothetical protein [Candidatus Thermoplasmatota archaeon]
MNQKLFRKNKLIEHLKIKRNQLLFLMFVVIIVSILIFGVYLTLFNSEQKNETWMTGTVFIDGVSAPAGIQVTIIFPTGIAVDENGTNETGMFLVDVTDFIGQSF